MPKGKSVERPTRAGVAIALLRAANCVTQQELADTMGLNKAYIASLETGKAGASVKRLEEIGTALGVEPLVIHTLIDSHLYIGENGMFRASTTHRYKIVGRALLERLDEAYRARMKAYKEGLIDV